MSERQHERPTEGPAIISLGPRRGAAYLAPGEGSLRMVDRPPSRGLSLCVPDVDHAASHTTPRRGDTMAANLPVAICDNGAGPQLGHTG